MSPRSRGIVPLGLLAALGSVYLATMATYDVTNDAQTASVSAWRIAQTGAPWLDGVDLGPYEPGPFKLWVDEGADGHLVGYRSPGVIAAGVPAYVAARLAGIDGYSLVPGSVTAALLTTAAMGLLFLAVRPRVGTAVAAGSVLVLGLTTPVWSVAADSMWSHPVTIVGIAGMAWAGARERWWLVGLFGGVALWGRLHCALIVAILGIGLAVAHRRPRIAVTVGLVSGGFLALATLWSHWMYGTWSPAGGYGVSFYADAATGTVDLGDRLVNQLGMWVAPDRGILVWTPLLLVLGPAVARAWRALPAWTRWLAVSGVAYTLVQGQLNDFAGGASLYGYRLTLELLVCLFPVYAMSLPEAGRWARRLLGPVVGLQFAIISFGALGDGGPLSERAWTFHAFLHAVVQFPGLVLWPVLMTVGGALVGHVLRRRSILGDRSVTTDEGAGTAAPVASASRVGPVDHQHRV